MKDINFNTLKEYASSLPEYKINDMGFSDEEAFFQAASDRVEFLREYFSEVYFLEKEDEAITYTQSTGRQSVYRFHPIEVPVSSEEFIKIRDNIYDRGGDPNKIVLGVWKLFQNPNYDTPYVDRSKNELMEASYFVKS